MIIGVTGSTKVGKTTFINDFIKKYTRYGQPQKTYRDIPNLKLYQNGTEESQRLIRDFMFNQIRELWSKRDTTKWVILDRTLLDNLAVTMVLYTMGKISEDFLEESIKKTKQAMQYYHCIYFIPIEEHVEITLPEGVTEDFRLSFDIILNTYYNEYERRGPLANTLFPSKNCAFLDKVTGTRQGRIDYVSEILDERGDVIGGFDEEVIADNILNNIVGADGLPAFSEQPEFELEDFGFNPEKVNFDLDLGKG